MDFAQATLTLLVLYMAVTILHCISRSQADQNIQDFAVGKGFSPTLVGLSLAASITSAATFIINPGFVAFLDGVHFWPCLLFCPSAYSFP